MDYRWDPEKARNNLLKHKISFADAVSVFSDDHAITIEDDFQVKNVLLPLGWTH